MYVYIYIERERDSARDSRGLAESIASRRKARGARWRGATQPRKDWLEVHKKGHLTTGHRVET